MNKLLEYLSGKKRGKDARYLERLSMQDDFLKEAVDGYDEIQGDHIRNIKSLESKILENTVSQKNKFPILAVASSIIILIFIGIIYLLIIDQKKEEKFIAYEKSDKNVNDKNLLYSINNSSSNNNEGKQTFKSAKGKLKNKIHTSTQANNITKKKLGPKDFFQNTQSEAIIGEGTDTVANKLIVHQDFFKELNHENSVEPIVSLKSMNRSFDLENVKNSNSSISEEDHTTLIDSLIVQSLTYTINLKKTEERDTTRFVYKNKNGKDDDLELNSKTQFKSQPIIGWDKFYDYIYENLLVNYQTRKSIGVQIAVGFSVGKEGRPENIHILQSTCNRLANKIIKLIKDGCDWTEGEGIFTLVR